MKHTLNKLVDCTFCGTPIRGWRRIWRCEKCDVPMHRRCWTSNLRKCPIYGCVPGEPEPVLSSPSTSGGWGVLGLLVWVGMVVVGAFSESTKETRPDYPEPQFRYEPTYDDYELPDELSGDDLWELIQRVMDNREEERYDESNEI